jgi:tetratricopeptide (TPR) repeat protein
VTHGRLAIGALALSTGLWSACATVPAPKPPRPNELRFEPEIVVGNPRRDADIEKLNDEELFACGTSSYASAEAQKEKNNDTEATQSYERAARCFSRLCDAFPQSPHRNAATYNAGLAYERLSQWELALERFKALMDPAKGTGDAIDASFRAAETYYHLDNYDPAIEILNTLAARTDLDVGVQLEAITQKGICLLESGDLEAAETTLRAAIRRFEDEKEKERLDDYYPAQAQFFLGEVYRIHFSSITLDPNAGEEKTAKDLELKCEMLLSSQGHYLRAIRIGNGQWATASGFRIGALYEELYDHLIHAPVPSDLDAEQATMYRKQLEKRVQILVTKAIGIYERTLSAAERIGVDTPFVKQTQAALDRMKAILLTSAEEAEREKAQEAGSSGKPPDPKGAHDASPKPPADSAGPPPAL